VWIWCWVDIVATQNGNSGYLRHWEEGNPSQSGTNKPAREADPQLKMGELMQ